MYHWRGVAGNSWGCKQHPASDDQRLALQINGHTNKLAIALRRGSEGTFLDLVQRSKRSCRDEHCVSLLRLEAYATLKPFFCLAAIESARNIWALCRKLGSDSLTKQ